MVPHLFSKKECKKVCHNLKITRFCFHYGVLRRALFKKKSSLKCSHGHSLIVYSRSMNGKMFWAPNAIEIARVRVLGVWIPRYGKNCLIYLLEIVLLVNVLGEKWCVGMRSKVINSPLCWPSKRVIQPMRLPITSAVVHWAEATLCMPDGSTSAPVLSTCFDQENLLARLF